MKTMLTIIVIVTAAIAPVAQADPGDVFDMDKYDAKLKQGNVVENDENTAIVMGLIACNGVAAKGSRDAWISGVTDHTEIISVHEETVITDAALDVFCPQLKGH
jgi:hypothetical protein